MAFSLSAQNVSRYLQDIGLCSAKDAESLRVEPQEFVKNFNLLVSFPHRNQLLVKQERPSLNGQSIREFVNEWQFYQLLQQFPELSEIRTWVSETIHFDDRNSILVYNYLSNYVDLAGFYHQEQVFPTEMATAVGTILANVHRLTFKCQKYCNFIEQGFDDNCRHRFSNPARRLQRIGPEIFGTVPADALKFFVLYQRYESLGAAIADLEVHWYPCCLTHNDLKLNNILVRKGREDYFLSDRSPDGGDVRLIDWERSAWGDPAFDLGYLLASYLGMWLSSLVVDPSIELEESLQMATTPLAVLQPSLCAIVQAYLKTFPLILEHRSDFLQHVIRYAGLSLIHQIDAMIYYQKSFDNTGICMLQVAKSLLCRPMQSFSVVFGMPESELVPNSTLAA